MNSYIIRKASMSDADQLAEFAHQLNLFHGDTTTPDPARLQQDWHLFEAYLIGTGEEEVGFLAGFDSYQFHFAAARFEIQNLFVTEEHRGSGAAYELMKAVIAIKYEQGIQKFSLGVENTNGSAIKFYEKLGFSEAPSNNLRFRLSGDSLQRLMETG